MKFEHGLWGAKEGNRMTVIDEKPVPLYVKECTECGSTFTYKKAEVGFGNNIYCPVCGVSLWASFRKIKDEGKETDWADWAIQNSIRGDVDE